MRRSVRRWDPLSGGKGRAPLRQIFVPDRCKLQDLPAGLEKSLQDSVEILYNWIEHICHVASSHDCNSLIQSGLIAGGKDATEGRQTVLFRAVDPMSEPQKDEPYDVKKPRMVLYRTKWKVYQNAVYCISPSSLTTLYQPTVLKKWSATKSYPQECLPSSTRRPRSTWR